jgi:hypothetical protein
LKGKTFKVGFDSNTGGLKGAYKPTEGESSRYSLWSGPLANFVSDAALLGGFTVNITSPPKRLQLKSQEFFSGNSDFDLCVYATALDYLDFCISSYTIPDKRSSITTMFETMNDPIYLILPASHD